MGLVVALPVLEDIQTENGLLQKVKPSLFVASGLQRESQIDLYVATYEAVRQASVFIYPAWYDLHQENVLSLDPQFSDVSDRIISQEFKDTSVEELDRAFVEQIKPLMSFMDREYRAHKPIIIAHCFQERAAGYLEGVIRDLKLK